MKRLSFDVDNSDYELLKELASSQMYDLDEYLPRFISEALRPYRAEKYKRDHSTPENTR